MHARLAWRAAQSCRIFAPCAMTHHVSFASSAKSTIRAFAPQWPVRRGLRLVSQLARHVSCVLSIPTSQLLVWATRYPACLESPPLRRRSSPVQSLPHPRSCIRSGETMTKRYIDCTHLHLTCRLYRDACFPATCKSQEARCS